MKAEISAPTPPVRFASWTIRTFPVFFTDVMIISRSNGMSVRRSSTSTSTPSPFHALAGQDAGRLQRPVNPRPVGDDRDVAPRPLDVGPPDRDVVITLREFAFDMAVQVLVLEVEHGVRFADRRPDQTLRVVRRRGRYELQPRWMKEPRLDIGRME